MANEADAQPYAMITGRLDVPLDYSNKSGKSISLFHRIVYTLQKGAPYKKAQQQKPMFAYLCGGPGSPNPSTAVPHINEVLLNRGAQVLFLDYRGCGESTPVNAATMAGKSADEVKAIMVLMNQVNIARDLWSLKTHLQQKCGFTQFNLICQSFGGWIATSLMSMTNVDLHGVEIHLFGAVPPVNVEIDSVYENLYDVLVSFNRKFYQVGADRNSMVKEIVAAIMKKGKTSSNSAKDYNLAVQILGQGRRLGAKDGIADLHNLMSTLYQDINSASPGKLSAASLTKLQGYPKFTDRPLYALMHEAIYAAPDKATRCSAYRVGQRKGFRWIEDLVRLMEALEQPEPILFSGEMIYPQQYLAYEGLTSFAKVAEELSSYDKWESLYDLESLRKTKAIVRATVYPDDMYVCPRMSLMAANLIGNCTVFVPPKSKGWLHQAVRDKETSATVLKNSLDNAAMFKSPAMVTLSGQREPGEGEGLNIPDRSPAPSSC